MTNVSFKLIGSHPLLQEGDKMTAPTALECFDTPCEYILTYFFRFVNFSIDKSKISCYNHFGTLS
jgi:hypothetical protein